MRILSCSGRDRAALGGVEWRFATALEQARLNMATRRVALCLMAHPDDCEFLAAGTLALLRQRGWQVHIATATAGDAGTTSQTPLAIAAQRRKEATAAAALIGAEYHCLELRDLHV